MLVRTKRRCSASSVVNAWITRIAPIVRCATAHSALSLTRESLASAFMRRLMPTMERKSTGTIPSAINVSTQSSRSITTSMPTSITSELTIGKKPFMVSVWMAKVSAVRR